MHANNFVLDDYLKRIGFSGPLAANADTLARLMRAQLFSVPFENLDVQAGKVVSMTPEDIVQKIVYQPRGGYCYEVNGLFAMALQAIGLPYCLLAARPMFYPVRRPKTHMVLLVRADGRDWLCDLGFGSYGIRAPMALDGLDTPVAQDDDLFRLSRDADGVYLLQAWVDGQWANQYGFDLHPQEWIDFAPANYLNSTHPEAIFVQKRLVVLHTPQGRKILLGDSLKRIENGVTRQHSVPAEQADQLLVEEFALSLPA